MQTDYRMAFFGVSALHCVSSSFRLAESADEHLHVIA
jgi:hypothetical protein